MGVKPDNCEILQGPAQAPRPPGPRRPAKVYLGTGVLGGGGEVLLGSKVQGRVSAQNRQATDCASLRARAPLWAPAPSAVFCKIPNDQLGGAL